MSTGGCASCAAKTENTEKSADSAKATRAAVRSMLDLAHAAGQIRGRSVSCGCGVQSSAGTACGSKAAAARVGFRAKHVLPERAGTLRANVRRALADATLVVRNLAPDRRNASQMRAADVIAAWLTLPGFEAGREVQKVGEHPCRRCEEPWATPRPICATNGKCNVPDYKAWRPVGSSCRGGGGATAGSCGCSTSDRGTDSSGRLCADRMGLIFSKEADGDGSDTANPNRTSPPWWTRQARASGYLRSDVSGQVDRAWLVPGLDLMLNRPSTRLFDLDAGLSPVLAEAFSPIKKAFPGVSNASCPTLTTMLAEQKALVLAGFRAASGSSCLKELDLKNGKWLYDKIVTTALGLTCDLSSACLCYASKADLADFGLCLAYCLRAYMLDWTGTQWGLIQPAAGIVNSNHPDSCMKKAVALVLDDLNATNPTSKPGNIAAQEFIKTVADVCAPPNSLFLDLHKFNPALVLTTIGVDEDDPGWKPTTPAQHALVKWQVVVAWMILRGCMSGKSGQNVADWIPAFKTVPFLPAMRCQMAVDVLLKWGTPKLTMDEASLKGVIAKVLGGDCK